MTQKESLAEALLRITELEQQAVVGAETIARQDAAIIELTTKLTESEAKVSDQAEELATSHALIAAMTADAEDTEAQLATAVAKNDELTRAAKSLDELADGKAREIAARNGTVLPPKQPGVGDKTTEGDATAGLRGLAKATAYFASRQPGALTT